MSRPRLRVPHTLALIFAMIVLAQLLTYVLPQGEFKRETFPGTTREAVVPGTYATIEPAVTLAPWHSLTAIPRGFSAAQEIIFFVFIIGGAFGVFRATGAADAVIGAVLRRMGDRPALLIVGGVAIFQLGSSTIGMAEEYLPFIPLLVSLCLALGYDSVTAVGIMCVGYGIGYATAVINPFTVIVAQNVAGIEQASGMGLRLILSVVFLAIGAQHVLRYARRVRADPSKSLVADLEADPRAGQVKDVRLSASHVASLAVVGLAIAGLVAGIELYHWYLMEMGAIFLGVALLLGVVGRLGMDQTATTFCAGAAELTTTALLIGFARTIEVILNDGQIIDTVVHAISGPLQYAGPYVSAVGMYVVQSFCNLFIPSGSGQAYVTMPLMAPLADLTGVTRQVAVLAYQFGDGFTNILLPTNAVLIGILAMARIPFERWLKFVVPFVVKTWIAGSIVLMIAVAIGYR